MIVVLVAALAGGTVAWKLTSRQTSLATDTPGAATSSTAPAKGAPLTGSPGAQTGPLSGPPATPAPATPTPATQSPAGVSVAIASGAAQQSAASGVAAFMASYFNTINRRDYQGYLSKFDAQARPGYSRQKFLAEFGTTTDSSPELAALRPLDGGLLATVTFTSHQSPALSATHTACTDWTQQLYLVASGSTYVIGTSPPGSPQTTYAAC